MNAINCSVLESPSTSDDDEMNNGVFKSTLLEPTIKLLLKETRLCRRTARNFLIRGHNIKIINIPNYKIFPERNGRLLKI